MDPLERRQAHLQPKGLLQLVEDMLLIDATCINHSFELHYGTMGNELGEGASMDRLFKRAITRDHRPVRILISRVHLG